MFADDSLFFFKAEEGEARNMKDILSGFEEASGQMVNYRKSGVFYSSNVNADLRMHLFNILEVHAPLNHGKYLGLPSLIGNSKKAVFSFLRDKVWEKTQNWKNKVLSRAGKEILLKSVAQAVPAYCMNIFQIPQGLCRELQCTMNAFWWGTNSEESKGIKWLKRDRMATSKKKGGLGFKNLQSFNLAMLGKQGWRLGNSSNTIAARVLKAKYYPSGEFWKAQLGYSPSFTWRSIWSSQKLLDCGRRWRVGDGDKIQIWLDPWVLEMEKFLLKVKCCVK